MKRRVTPAILFALALGPAGCGGELTAADADPTADGALEAASACPTKSHNASAVFSSDNCQLLVSQIRYQQCGNNDPTHYRYRLVSFAVSGTSIGKQLDNPPFRFGFVPGDPTTIESMSHEGYKIAQVQNMAKQGQFEAHRLGGDGTDKLLATGQCDTPQVTPSPDEKHMAVMQSQASCSGSSGPLMGSTFTIRFLDAAGNKTGGSATVSFKGWGVGTWTRAGDFIATDGNQAFKIALGGAVSATSIPRCSEPATTSSNIAADGRVVSVDPNTSAISITTGSSSQAFGCQ